MDTSEPSHMEEEQLNQVHMPKTSKMQRVLRVVQKSCSRAGHIFCRPSLSCERVFCLTAQMYQSPEVQNSPVDLQGPPSTILIVNISNSTLTDCNIGSVTYPSTVPENHHLHESEVHMPKQMGCSFKHDQQRAAQTTDPQQSTEPQSVNISNSRVSCVIIGHNNSMQVDATHSPETGPDV